VRSTQGRDIFAAGADGAYWHAGLSSMASSYQEPTGRPLAAREPSMPKLSEDSVLAGEVLTNGIDELTRQDAPSVKRPPSGVFSGAGDSGVWPGQAPAAGALAFITPTTIVFILVWYVTGALTNSTSKQTLSLFKSEHKPFLSLTLMQHLVAAFCGTFAIRVLRLKQHKALPSEAMTWGFYRLIAVYTVGFCLTNGSFGKVNASFVDTIKAGEPIATVLLTILLLPGERVTPLVFLSLLPIVGGVATSSLSEASFNMLGFCMAMGSNICFSARSICAKLLRSSLGKQMDNANLFVYINLYGALCLFPVAVYVEGPLLLTVLMNGGTPARFFLLNGFFYYLNNQMNFLVLEKVDAVTHGLINCGRRVANICFAIVWFGTAVTLYNGVGITLALSGAYCYMKAKQISSRPASSQPATPSSSPFLSSRKAR